MTKWNCLWIFGIVLGWLGSLSPLEAQEILPSQTPASYQPYPDAESKPLPINLPTALQLAKVQPADIALASERIQIALAQLQRARWQWLPNLYLGTDYYRHDGQLQDVGGIVFGTSKSSLMVGGGATAVFALSDAIFAPLAARQDVRARDAGLVATHNDLFLAVGETYFTIQQACADLVGALEAVVKAEELVRRAEKLAPGLVPPVEAVRARAELARRKQAVHVAGQNWRTASAELVRLLRLDASVLLQPLEPTDLQITLVPWESSVDALIPLALSNRPELASQQALVQATLERLKQERLRPLVPSILMRGASANPSGQLSAGMFGGGRNSQIGNFSARSDWDIQVLWELQNLGLGNLARMNEKRAENRQAVWELFKTQDRVAAEVVQAHAQVQAAVGRVREARAGLDDAKDSVKKNLEGMTQTRMGKTAKLEGDVSLLLIRPQEVVAAIQALALAYGDFNGAIADYNRAQFRLFRALGKPSQLNLAQVCPCSSVPVRRVFLGNPRATP